MRSKRLIFADEARQNLFIGMNMLAQTITPTLGPAGRNVAVDGRSQGATKRYAPPQIVAQGYHIIRDMELENPLYNLGVKLLKEAAQQTDELVGDGTSTTVFLANFMVREGMKNITAGAHPMSIKRGMERAAHTASQAIRAIAVPVQTTQDIFKVLKTAAGSPEIAEALLWAFEEIGINGMMLIERYPDTLGLVVECIHGFQYDRGFLSSYFVTDPKEGGIGMENPYILITDEEITDCEQILPLLETIRKVSAPHLLVIAPKVEESVLGLLIANHQRQIIRCAAIRPPAAGEVRRQMMEDLCIFTGATLISPMNGYTLPNVTLDRLGQAESAYITAEKTTIVAGKGDPDLIHSRIDELRGLILTASALPERERLDRRIAQLGGGLARIRVGGATEAEMDNLIEQVEAALASMRSTIDEGIVPGAGVALAVAGQSLTELQITAEADEAVGIAIVKQALEALLSQIAANAGENGRVTLATVQRLQSETEGRITGYDADQKTYCNVLEQGIFDSCKTVRTLLANAASCAVMVLTTEAVILCREPTRANRTQ